MDQETENTVHELSAVDGTTLEQIADLHLRCLPGSVLTDLGPSVLKAYYRAACGAEQEHVFVILQRKAVIGVCLLSRSPQSIMKRLIYANLWLLTSATLFGVFRSANIRSFIYGILRPSRGTGRNLLAGMPEVVQIFVSSGARGGGYGKALLDAVERQLKTLGIEHYYLKTESTETNAALSFYAKFGFDRQRLKALNSDGYVYLSKTLYSA